MPDPVTLQQLVGELEKMQVDMDAGKLQTGEYDQRLTRMIGEIRDRKLDGDRAAITAALADALARGVITPAVKEHIERRLGLA